MANVLMSPLAQPEFLEMLRMKARFTVITLLALVTGTAAASDWKVVVTHPSGSYVDMIDVSSLTRHGSIVRAWVRTVFAEPQVVGEWTFLSERTRYYYDCAERRWASKETSLFADRDFRESVYRGNSTEDALLKWRDVAPDTPAEIKLNFACSKAPK